MIPTKEKYVICSMFEDKQAFFKDVEELGTLQFKIFWTRKLVRATLLEKENAHHIISTYIKHKCRTLRYL